MSSPSAPSRSAPADSLALRPAPSVAAGDSILERLAAALEKQGIAYCQWKGHWSAHRWSTGLGDVDLLVDHGSRLAFRRLVEELGFKPAEPAASRHIAGTEHYIGHDPAVSRLLHLHVHYRLLLGDYWRPVYRLPLERPLLANAIPGNPFQVPAPAYQYLVFVLRMMLRQVGRPLLSAQTLWTTGIRIQLEALESSSNREELATVLAQHLRPVDLEFFDRCVGSLQGRCGALERATLPWALHRRLRAHVRATSPAAVVTAGLEKFVPSWIAERITDGRMRLSDGGLVVALVGGDGAEKSTCARELHAWLAPFRTMRAHLGNPPRSWLTLAVGGALMLEQALDRLLKRPARTGTTIQLLHHLCTARDRYSLYVKIRRFAVSGGIGICERYPITENRLLVGPVIPQDLPPQAGGLARLLCALEARYYDRILRPDLVVVLQLDPELAVIRKPEESADYVRASGPVIWNTDWSASGAHVVDATQPLDEVMRRLKTIIWSHL